MNTKQKVQKQNTLTIERQRDKEEEATDKAARANRAALRNRKNSGASLLAFDSLMGVVSGQDKIGG
jgi:hypothetical protein